MISIAAIGQTDRSSADPGVEGALVVEQLVRPEPQSELARGTLRRIAGMDQVLARLEREVTPDAAGCRLVRAGRAVDGAAHGDGVQALERERHERCRGDEVDQPSEERLG